MRRLILTIVLVLTCSVILRAETIRLVTSGKANTDAYQYGYRVLQEIGKRMGDTILLTTIPAKRIIIALKDGDKYHGDIAQSINLENRVPDGIRVKEPIIHLPYMAITTLNINTIDKERLKPYRIVFRTDNRGADRQRVPYRQTQFACAVRDCPVMNG